MKMEEITIAAVLHYNSISDSEKQRVQKVFNDAQDAFPGLVSERTLIRTFSNISEVCISKLFSRIDKGCKKWLNFDEFKTFYYVITYRPICHNCWEVVLGHYYCCVQCWKESMSRSPDIPENIACFTRSYTLCLRCFTSNSFFHPHEEFLDNYVFLLPGGRQENEIKDILRAGRLYYKSLPPEDKRIADDAFSEVDRDGNSWLTERDVIDFMRSRNMPLDVNKIRFVMSVMQRQCLDIEDAVSLWYAFVMRPSCKGCNRIINGCYYSCVECSCTVYNNRGYPATFDVCQNCYVGLSFSHHHHFFLDNYAMLRMKSLQVGSSQAIQNGLYPPVPTNDSMMPVQILDPDRRLNWMLGAVAKFSLSSLVGVAASALCTIM